MTSLYLTIVLAPLLGAIVAGLLRNWIGRSGAHWVTILSVAVSCGLSLYALYGHAVLDWPVYNENLYTWLSAGGYSFHIGFLVDELTVLMMAVVTFVSLMVHVYTIGYMHDDPGYQRFFSYISLFTFSMLILVMANNFLQLFVGWEAVGLVSYLLIGFWFRRETAVTANMKAFLVNRVGDFGFLLGIAAVLMVFGSLDYATVFAAAPAHAAETVDWLGDGTWSVITIICLLLFVGAMGKSAQVPLHVWLPDSMEGPTPISALIHAATMVTAGIFMVARMSPLYELSETALSVILVIGAVTALFMGLVGLVQNDIKRVVAYSTLSQLGYMTVALGASAYSAAIFHLMTHAFFKALLFLGAGSVIIAMHHEQDMRKMGGLRKYMPVTFLTAWIGTLALTGMPGLSGFFSKDAIIEAVHHAERAGSDFAYGSVLLGVLITALYSFRMLYLTFHGKERMDEHTRSHLHESPWVVTVPLILLAVPSVAIGWLTFEPILFGGWFDGVITVLPQNDVLARMGENVHGGWSFVLHGLAGPAFWLALTGFAVASWIYLKRPELADRLATAFSPLVRLLENKYYMDHLYMKLLAGLGRVTGTALWKAGDQTLIDGVLVNGSARSVGFMAGVLRHLQTGRIYHYVFAMLAGLVVLAAHFLF